ncbi:MAG: DUF222 domain-containing protein [Acidimicrobiales bacterium]
MERTEAEAEAARLEREIAEVCGLLNAANARLVGLIADVLATESWQGWRTRSPEHWVAWKCGVSPGRARSLVAIARRLRVLPETKAAFDAGELSEDQVAVVCRHAPESVDAEAAELARSATVTQLRRVLGGYSFEAEAEAAKPAEERRQVTFNYTDDGSWRLSALLPPDEGALWERALTESREALVRAGETDVSWADAFVAIVRAERGDRATILLHIDNKGSHLHLGPAVPDGLRTYLTCDSRARVVYEHGGKAVSVGRAFRTVPERTRIAVEERDRGCRVPGCSRTKWLHVHHIRHWENGGTTDTPNLITLCSKHHPPAPPRPSRHRGRRRRPGRDQVHRSPWSPTRPMQPPRSTDHFTT